jgi:protein involved in polysaccharide export with SLBB domain
MQPKTINRGASLSACSIRPVVMQRLTQAVSHLEVIMGSSSLYQRLGSRPLRFFAVVGLSACQLILPSSAGCQMLGHLSPLSSRDELTAAASEAETRASTGDPSYRSESALIAAAYRQRLRDGDLQVGDRVIVSYTSDVVHSDTVVVRGDRVLELAGPIVIPVGGLLRSELKARVSAELLKYVKAERIEVIPLMRVGVLGAVTRPGYFAFRSDMPLSDAIMGAGGLTPIAAVEQSIIRRQNGVLRSASETNKAIAGGLTLDQFGLAAGDEIVVGQHNGFDAAKVIGLAGALASVVAVILSLDHQH